MGKQSVAGGDFLYSTPRDGARRVCWEYSISTPVQIRVWNLAGMVEDEKTDIVGSGNRTRVHRVRSPKKSCPTPACTRRRSAALRGAGEARAVGRTYA